MIQPAPQLASFEDWPMLADEHMYHERLAAHQLRMLRIQQHLHRHGKTAIVVFEGWDAAGKGGAIRRLLETLDPRGYQVHAVGAPTDEESAHHYLWRFWRDLPALGHLAVFDRSWYGRVLVERVDKLTPAHRWRQAYDEINEFERLMVNNGTPVVKLYLHISKHEQATRFRERQADPLKSWKLTPADWHAHEQYADYYQAADEMLSRTHTEWSPWSVVSANYKWYARTHVLDVICAALERHQSSVPAS